MAAPASILIESRQPDNPAIGTGFVFSQAADGRYVLTCAHVVELMGGPDQVRAAGLPAEVVALGEPGGIDLAVLRVAGSAGPAPLPLRAGGDPGRPVRVAGYYQHPTFLALELIDGTLGPQLWLPDHEQRHVVPAWYVALEGAGRRPGGLRGAPLCDAASGAAFGVMIAREGEAQGRAIAVEALALIWPGLPASLIGPPLDRPAPPAAPDPAQLPSAAPSLIDFGSGNTIGDITISDIAGRDMLSITAQAGREPRSQPATIDVLLVARRDPGAVAQSRPGEYLIDWTDDYLSGEPRPELWERQLMRDLLRARGQFQREGRSHIRLRALADTAAAFAFGAVFNQRAGFQIHYSDGDGGLWRSDEPITAASPLLRRDTIIDATGRDLALQVAVTAATNVTGPVDAWLRLSAQPQPPGSLDLAGFRRQLSALFNDSELRELCFDLGVDYESLPGQGKSDRARELIAYLARRGQSALLLDACRQLRPHAGWDSLTQPAAQARPAPLQRRILLACDDPQPISPAQGSAIARQVGDLIAYEGRPGGTVHLFCAIPAGIALLIGWGVRAPCALQLYALDRQGAYQPTVRLTF